MKLSIAIRKQLGAFQLDAHCTLDEIGQTGLFGASGSGKTTLVHLLAGLANADSGQLCLGDTILFDSQKGINLPPHQRRIGLVFQHACLFPHMSAQGNLLYGWRRTPPKERHIDPQAVIEALNLEHLLQRSVHRLSGGERQRLALGRTVLTCPRLILMDEPLSGLDEDLKQQVIPYIKNVCGKFSIPLLFISHSIPEMCIMTDHVLLLAQGRVLRKLPSKDLQQCSWADLFYS